MRQKIVADQLRRKRPQAKAKALVAVRGERDYVQIVAMILLALVVVLSVVMPLQQTSGVTGAIAATR